MYVCFWKDHSTTKRYWIARVVRIPYVRDDSLDEWMVSRRYRSHLRESFSLLYSRVVFLDDGWRIGTHFQCPKDATLTSLV
jgi:hypothetical protein